MFKSCEKKEREKGNDNIDQPHNLPIKLYQSGVGFNIPFSAKMLRN
jgi:hypothetical protein